MICNKNLNPTVTELIITGQKLSNSYAFITQYYFAVPNEVRLDSAHYFTIKISYESFRKLHQVAFNHSLDIYLKDFINIYKYCTEKPYSSLVIPLTSDNILRFRKILLKTI